LPVAIVVVVISLRTAAHRAIVVTIVGVFVVVVAFRAIAIIVDFVARRAIAIIVDFIARSRAGHAVHFLSITFVT